jgi:hypothetical protein
MTQRNAIVRCCASCEWIYRAPAIATPTDCPKCGFASYGARHVHGRKCYTYEQTQQPWIDRKVATYRQELISEVIDANEIARTGQATITFSEDDHG